MFCTRCGVELRDADHFCSQCGHVTSLGPAPSALHEHLRLARDVKHKKIAGVCAGFARYMEVDVTLMRILWLVAALMTGVGFIAYVVAWILMPKDTGPEASPATQVAQTT